VSKSLEACGLVKRLGGRIVVDDVHLTVAPGEIIGLVGPNGAGKTTTFRIVLGLTEGDAGTIRLDGVTLDNLPLHERARRGLGYLPQGPSVLGRLSTRDNLVVVAEALARPRDRVDELLLRFGLGAVARQRAATLSGGERRRLELARALLAEPRYLLLDEPFAGIDPKTVAGLSALLVELAGDGVGLVITDHAVRDAMRLCQRMLLIADGRIVEAGTPAELAASATARRVYLGEGFEA